MPRDTYTEVIPIPNQSKLGNLVFTAALDERLRRRDSRVKALACTPGVCATDMYVHVQTLSNPNAVVDLTAVPSPEDGSLAQVSKSVRR